MANLGCVLLSGRAAMIVFNSRPKPPSSRQSASSRAKSLTFFIRFWTSVRVLTCSTRRLWVYNRCSQSTLSQSHDDDRLIRTATSRLAWSADLSLLMWVPPMTIPTDGLLPARSRPASNLILLARSRVGEMMTADSSAVAPASRRR
jgi:hypothetical protein